MTTPTTGQMVAALRLTADLLGEHEAAHCFGNRFLFPLDAGWSLAISADDAGRFRLEACYRSRIRATMWCRATDQRRLKALVLAARDEALALTA